MKPLDAAKARPLEGGPAFSLTNRISRVLWRGTWLLLARWTPPPFHPWRALLLRAFGAHIGKGVQLYSSVRVWLPANLEIGDNCMIGPNVQLYNQGRIAIGARTIISQGAYVCASTHDISDYHFQLQLRPIAIGSQCWIAADAFVGPGVTMQDRAVLAARGALFTNAEEDGVYRGNPAEFIKKRKFRNQ